MKKVLLASTMLVATAGMAAADLTFNGFGRFGLYYEENNTADDETRLEQRFRLNIVGTATTDGGVKFGARMRIETNDNGDGRGETHDADSGTNATDEGAVRAPEFNIQAGGFRVDVGNTSDVIDSGDVVNYYGYGVGLTAFAEQSSGFSLPASGINDEYEVAPTLKARYTISDFTIAASYTADSTETTNEEWQIGAGYSFGDYSVGVAFGAENDGTNLAGSDDFWAASFSGDLGSFGFSLLVADHDSAADTAYGASVSVPVGAATEVRAVISDNGVTGDETAYAIGFIHDLGGGVELKGGVGENNSGNTVGDFGVIFNF